MEIQLHDGSRIIGKSALQSLPFQTSYARLDLKLELIQSLDLSSSSGECTTSLRNGDVLKGTLTVDELEVNTIFGKVVVPLRFIQRVTLGNDNPLNGLVLYFPFEFLPDGRVADRSGHEHHGVVHSPGNKIRRSSDGAVHFSGRREYIECGSTLELGVNAAFTILLWINPEKWNTYGGGLVSKKKSDATTGFVLYDDGLYPSKFNVRIHGSSGYEAGTDFALSRSDVLNGAWQQWGVTYDPNAQQLVLYLNGARDTAYQGIELGDLGNDTSLRFGNAHTWDASYTGWMKQVMIFNRPLNAAEISSLWRSQQPGR